MKFKLNNINWQIKEMNQKEIKKIINKKRANEEEIIDNTDSRYFGISYTDENIIYIDKDLPIARKKKTLLHELEHSYISEFITHENKSYTEEDVADIFSNSYDIITEIANKYFK